MDVRGILVLFSLVFTVISCTEGTPEFTDLGSEFSAPTFDSQSKIYLLTDLTSDSPAISGTCDITTSSIGTKPQGQSDYDNVSTNAISSSSDLDCSDGTFHLVLQDAGNYMGFTSGLAGQKTLSIQTMAVDGDNAAGEVILRYLPDPPQLSVTELSSVAEGLPATVVISISPRATFGAIVDYQTASGTATSADYTELNGSVSFGETDDAITFSVNTTNDFLYESTEEFSFGLSNPVGAFISIASGSLTITSSDPAPTASVLSGSANEGLDTPLIVSLSEISGVNAILNWQAYDGSAVVASDLVGTSGVVTIEAGSTTASLLIPTVGDSDFEFDESYTVTITAANSDVVVSGSDSATGTIVNDDNAPNIFIEDITVNEGQTTMVVVSLSGTSASNAIFDIQTYDNLATAGAPTDYVGLSQQFTILAGFVTVIGLELGAEDDTVYDPAESYLVSISAVSGIATSGSDLLAAVNITDTDTAPVLQAFDAIVDEPGSDDFVVSLTGSTSEVTATFTFQSLPDIGAARIAILGSDYLAIAPATASIPAGNLAVTLSVNASNDGVYDDNETYLMSLSAASGASIGDGLATISINDDESLPYLQISGASVPEGGDLVFDVAVTPASQYAVSFSYTTLDGTATSAGGSPDYTADSGVIGVPITLGLVQITISSLGDPTFESNEEFTVSLSNALGATLNQGVDDEATGIIANDDAGPTVYISDASVVLEGATSQFEITLSETSGADIRLLWRTYSVFEAGALDYTEQTTGIEITIPSGTITFPGGLNVATTADLIDENQERFLVSLSVLSANAADGAMTARGFIDDNNAAPAIFVEDLIANEPETVDLVITLSAVSGKEITFGYSFYDGTAVASGDYQSLSGVSITIPAGEGGATLTGAVTIDSDVVFEGNEFFEVSLTDLGNVDPGDLLAEVSISDSQSAPSVSILAGPSQSEGDSGTTNFEFVVTMSGQSAQPVVVSLSTTDITTSADFTPLSNYEVTITQPEISATIPVLVSGDTVYETNETFNLSIVAVDGGATILVPNFASTATIQNDDAPPGLYISNASVTEDTTGEFTVSISEMSDVDVVFDWTIYDGTAVRGTDFSASATGSATLFAGGLSTPITIIGLPADVLSEGSEFFSVTIAINGVSAGDAVLIGNTGDGEIIDNDGPPNVYVSEIGVNEGAVANIVVSVDKADPLAITLAFADFTGTADAGDYTVVGGGVEVTIPASGLSVTLPIGTIDDSTYENNEVFLVSVTDSNGSTSNGFAVGNITIVNEDPLPQVEIFPVTANEGDNLEFVVSLDTSSGVDTAFDYVNYDGTATAAGENDYGFVSGRLTIGSGSLEVTITATGIEDTKYENNETFEVSLSNFGQVTTASVGTSDLAVGTISNDDDVPALFVTGFSLDEGSAGSVAISINVASGALVEGTVETMIGSSTLSAQPADFTGLSAQSFTIFRGDLSVTGVSVSAAADAFDEFDEVFTISTSSVTGVTIANGSSFVADVTILDQNPEPQIFVAQDLSESEANSFDFVISLSGSSEKGVSFDVQTLDGSAIDAVAGPSPQDYTAISQGYSIQAPLLGLTIAIGVNDDSRNEDNENFIISLSNEQNASFAGGGLDYGTVTIQDNDAVGTVLVQSLGDVEEGQPAIFRVSLTDPTLLSGGVNFNYETIAGTAGAADVTIVSGQLGNIAFLSEHIDITIPTVDDVDPEATESFVFSISGVSASGWVNDANAFDSVNLTDNDMSIFILDAGNVTEGGTAEFIVSLTGVTATDISFDFITVDGTAQESDSDYSAVTSVQNMTISSGFDQLTIPIPTTQDIQFESDEDFFVSISGASGASIVDDLGVASIVNDDNLIVQFAGASQNVKEGAETFQKSSFDVGNSHTCAVRFDGAAFCWGSNSFRRLGDGTAAVDRREPALVAAGDNTLGYKQVSAHFSFSCGISRDEKAYCWGRNDVGQLGTGDTLDADTAKAVSLGESSGVFTDIDTGTSHTCAIGDDQQVYCWGANGVGQLGRGDTSAYTSPVSIVAGGSTGAFQAISSGLNYSCGIDTSDTAHCWGRGIQGQLGNGASSDSLSPVAVVAGAGPGTYKHISSGDSHTCAIGSDDAAYCWGNYLFGRLGSGDSSTQNTPRAVQAGQGPGTYKTIKAGGAHTCALGTDDRVYCWGQGSSWQLGRGTNIGATSPVSIVAGGSPGIFLDIEVGSNNSCGLGHDNKMYCWGSGGDGKLGNGSTTIAQVPDAANDGANIGGTYGSLGFGSTGLEVIAYATAWLATDVVVDFTIAGTATGSGVDYDTPVALQITIPAGLLSGSIEIGLNDDSATESTETIELDLSGTSAGILGPGVSHDISILDDDPAPVEISILNAATVGEGASSEFIVSLSSPTPGDLTFDWLVLDGTARASDGDYSGSGVQEATILTGSDQVTLSVFVIDEGLAEPAESFSVSLSNPSSGSISIAQASGQITSNGVLEWNFANGSQTVDESLSETKGFAKVLSSGDDSTCLIGNDDNTYCWGIGGSGEIGNGTNGLFNEPQQVSIPSVPQAFKDLAQGGTHGCGLGLDHRLYCWGDNSSGQLGSGDTSARNTPGAAVEGAGEGLYQMVTAGGSHTCAIGMDGAAYCWGENGDRQLGVGGTVDRLSPTQVINGASPGSFKQVEAGARHTCAVGTNDSAYCWGEGGDGQLGQGFTGNSASPMAVASGEGVGSFKFVTAGNSFSCGIGTDDRAYCWGRGDDGRLGDGDTGDHSSPRAVSLSVGPGTYKSIGAGQDHACALGTDNRVYCWGSNGDGQLGDGTTNTSSSPVVAVDGANAGGSYKQLSVGREHTCAVGLNNRAYCWGTGLQGQVGDGFSSDRNSPTLVVGGQGSGFIKELAELRLPYVLLKLNGYSNLDQTIDLSLAGGTASSGVDFQISNTTLTIPAGFSSYAGGVSLINDGDVESTESILLGLVNQSFGTIGGTNFQTISVEDNDVVTATESIFVTDSLALESSLNAPVVVSLTASVASDVEFSYFTTPGTASPLGVDYVSISNQGTITSGNLAVTVNIPFLGDTENEADETIGLQISLITSNALIGDDIGLITILDDDVGAPVSLSGGSQYQVTISVGTTYAEFELWGAGGGSGRGSSVNNQRGTGGGGAGSLLVRNTGNVTVAIAGGGGGGAGENGPIVSYAGGSGAYIKIGIDVTPGEVFTVYSGGGAESACVDGRNGSGGNPGGGAGFNGNGTGAVGSEPAGGGSGGTQNNAGDGALAGGGGANNRSGNSGGAIFGGAGGQLNGGSVGAIGTSSLVGEKVYGSSATGGAGGGGGYYINTSVASKITAISGPSGASAASGGPAFGAYGAGGVSTNCPSDGGDGRVIFTPVDLAPLAELIVPETVEGGTIQATISLSEAASTPIVFRVDTLSGDATAVTDYTSLSGELVNFSIGQQAGNFSIIIAADTDPEFDESFLVSLSVNSGTVTVPVPVVAATILDDDNDKVLVVDGAGGSYLYDGSSTVSNICGGTPSCNSGSPYELNSDSAFMAISIVNGGVLTADAYSGGALGPGNGVARLLATSNIVLDSSSRIEMNGKGYRNNSDPGWGYGSASAQESFGGSHAGLGGQSSDYTSSSSSAYGNVFAPTLAGGAGGRIEGTSQVKGGGVVIIRSGGEFVLDGTIEVNGEDGLLVGETSSGGGAGGSILIETVTLSGSGGSLSAEGGASQTYSALGRFGGGGSGGRVALYFTETSRLSGGLTNPVISGLTVSTNYNADSGVTIPEHQGASGTFYWEDKDDPDYKVLELRGLAGTETSQLSEICFGLGDNKSFSHIRIAEHAFLNIPFGNFVETDRFLNGSEYGLGIYGEFDPGTASDLATVDYTLLYGGGTITGQVPNRNMNVGATGTLILAGSKLQVGDFTLAQGGFITHLPNTSSATFNRVDIYATGEMNILGTVDVSGKGRPGGLTGDGAGSSVSSGGASGGSYGGFGGKGTDAQADKSLYANMFGDLTLGAGGGESGTGDLRARGGAGGGLIRLVSEAKFNAGISTTVRANFLANGLDGEINLESGNIGGSGSGGGIELISNTNNVELFRSRIEARGGGVVGDGEGVFGGAGGGGRHYMSGGNSVSWPIPDAQDVRDLSPQPTSIIERPFSGGGGVRVEQYTGETWVFTDNLNIETLEVTPIYDPRFSQLNLTEFAILRGSRALIPAGSQMRVSPLSKFFIDEEAEGQPGYLGTISHTVDSALHIGGEWDGAWNRNTIDFHLVYENDAELSNPIVSMSANIDIDNDGSIEFKHDKTVRYFDNITISNGGLITHWFNEYSELYALNLSLSGSFVVENGGYVDVTGKGYEVGYGYQSGPTIAAGGSPANPFDYPGGGGHGGIGGEGDVIGGDTYGDSLLPETIGSGAGLNEGGIFAKLDILDGRGGGRVSIEADGGIDLQSGSFVLADGGAGDLATNRIGGGSGGSIKLSSSSGVFSSVPGLALIQAEGGSTDESGSGGGGRIAIDNVNFGQIQSNQIFVSAAGGADTPAGFGSGDGGQGSVYLGPATISLAASSGVVNEGSGVSFSVFSDRELPENVEATLVITGQSPDVTGGEVFLESSVVTILKGPLEVGEGRVFSLDDSIYELAGTESFNIRIDSLNVGSQVAVIGTGDTQALSINDNDPEPLAYIYDSVLVEGDGPSVVLVSLSHPFSGGNVEIAYNTVFTPPASILDLNTGSSSPMTGTLNINPPSVTAQLNYAAQNDGPDSDEYFTTQLTAGNLGSVTVGFARATNVNAILDVSFPKQVSVLDAVAQEGEDLIVLLTVQSQAPGAGFLTVDVTIGFDTASSADIDFGPLFIPGQRVDFDATGKGFATITIPTVLDGDAESTEALTVALSGAGGGGIDRDQAVLSILDVPQIYFDTSGSMISEDSSYVNVDVVLNNPIDRSSEFDIVVTGGSATASDYSFAQTSFNIPPGQSSTQVRVDISESPHFEFTDTIELQIIPTESVFVPTLGGVTIHTVSIADNQEIEVEPQFPGIASNWNQYVENSVPFSERSNKITSPDICRLTSDLGDGNTYKRKTHRNCVHGGESKTVKTSIETCDGLQMYDSRGAFQWHCEVIDGFARFSTYKLKDGRGLRDLVEHDGWAEMEAFIESDNHAEVSQSVADEWWSNEVIALGTGNCRNLSEDYAIYVHMDGTPHADPELKCNMIVEAEGVAVVTGRDHYILYDENPANQDCPGSVVGTDSCVVSALSQAWLWFEVNIEGTQDRSGANLRADKGINLRSTNFSVIRESNIVGGQSGIWMRSSRNNLVENVRISNLDGSSAANSALDYQSNSDYNVIRNVYISNSNSTGVNLSSVNNVMLDGLHISGGKYDAIKTSSTGSGNTLRDVSIVNNDLQALKLIGDDNTFVNFHIDRINNNAVELVYDDSGSTTLSADNNQFVNFLYSNIKNSDVVDTSTAGNTYTGSISGAATIGYIGVVEEDDPINPAVPDGSFNYDLSAFSGLDLILFSDPLKAFGNNVPSEASAFGNCFGPGCFMIDWNLSSADSQLRGQISDDNVTEATNCAHPGFDVAGSPGRERLVEDTTGNKFLTQAKERIGDGLGDEDGLCENFEECVEVQNLGFDQDPEDWTFSKSCINKSDGTSDVKDARIYGHEVKWDLGFDQLKEVTWSEISGTNGRGISIVAGETLSGRFPMVGAVPRTQGRYFFEIELESFDQLEGINDQFYLGVIPFSERSLVFDSSFELGNIRNSFVFKLLGSNGGADLEVNQSGTVITSPFPALQSIDSSDGSRFNNGESIGVAVDYTTGQFWIRRVSGEWYNGSGWGSFQLDSPTGTIDLDSVPVAEEPLGFVPAISYRPNIPGNSEIEVRVLTTGSPPHPSFKKGW